MSANSSAAQNASTTHTLLLRLAGPMQSWGVQSRFRIRDTATEPTKSGVIGLLCAALGRERGAAIDDLAGLRMGVRVDRSGQKRRDYHTVGQEGYLRARGQVETEDVVPTERYYLSDAHFLVGFEGEDLDLLSQVHRALSAPHWPLSLGRKAFPPGLPIYLSDGLCPGTRLLAALDAWQWCAGEQRPTRQPEDLRFVLEQWDRSPELGEPSVTHTRPDQPLSFQPRRFSMREVGVFRRVPSEWTDGNSRSS